MKAEKSERTKVEKVDRKIDATKLSSYRELEATNRFPGDYFPQEYRDSIWKSIRRWRWISDLPGQPRVCHGAAVSNGRIYVIGGLTQVARDLLYPGWETIDPRSATDGTVEFNPETETWRSMTPLNLPRDSFACVTAANGRIYVMGGITLLRDSVGLIERPSNAVVEFETTTNSWTTRSPMPVAASALGAAATSDGRIFAIGGYARESGEYLNVVQCYDTATDRWEPAGSRRPMPHARAQFAAVTANNGRIYAIGGMTPEGRSVDWVEEYDPVTDNWVSRASTNSRRFCLAAVKAQSNGRIYAMGGIVSCAPVGIVEEYDPTRDSLGWLPVTEMITGRHSLAAASIGDKIYAIGGAIHHPLWLLTSVEEGTVF